MPISRAFYRVNPGEGDCRLADIQNVGPYVELYRKNDSKPEPIFRYRIVKSSKDALAKCESELSAANTAGVAMFVNTETGRQVLDDRKFVSRNGGVNWIRPSDPKAVRVPFLIKQDGRYGYQMLVHTTDTVEGRFYFETCKVSFNLEPTMHEFLEAIQGDDNRDVGCYTRYADFPLADAEVVEKKLNARFTAGFNSRLDTRFARMGFAPITAASAAIATAALHMLGINLYYYAGLPFGKTAQFRFKTFYWVSVAAAGVVGYLAHERAMKILHGPVLTLDQILQPASGVDGQKMANAPKSLDPTAFGKSAFGPVVIWDYYVVAYDALIHAIDDVYQELYGA